MNSLFSYELDEKAIRLTLQNAEAEFSEADWDSFNNSFSLQTVKKNTPTASLVNFSLNLNRNILLPVFFIIGLGGVSAIMFRFVDLKVNKTEQVQKELIPEAANYKTEKKEEIKSAKKEEIKNETSLTLVKSNPAEVSVTSNTEAAQALVGAPLLEQNHASAVNGGNDSEKIQPVKSAVPELNKSDSANNNIAPPRSRKKRRKRASAEQMDVIQSPSLLSGSTSEEPELDIKMK